MTRPRQQRLRVLEALERRVRQFRIREELAPLRVPHEPLRLDDVVEEALGEEPRRFDPRTLRSRTLLALDWDDGSRWDAWVLTLASGLKVYCDTGHDETRVLASGGRNVGEESDRAFLQLLGESAGEHFGIEIGGSVPSRVRSSIDDREFLVDVFVDLFEVGRMEGSLRAEMARRGLSSAGADATGRDLRTEVARWLDAAIKSG
ncbi:MAG TPA: hypothetical protein VD833_01570 [Vicinamibacterales bacterium]|nr:hypothetical protein [Vicinamibacterales bacterium]